MKYFNEIVVTIIIFNKEKEISGMYYLDCKLSL